MADSASHRDKDAAAAEGVFLGKLRMSYSDTSAEVSEFAVESARTALHKFAKGNLKHFAEVAKVRSLTATASSLCLSALWT
jgi:hypothetical protein